MSAADNPKRTDGRDPIRVVLATGETKTLPYRQAVGLLSLGRATLAPEKAKKAAKKSETKLSTPDAAGVQEGAEAGNKPPSGPSDNGRA